MQAGSPHHKRCPEERARFPSPSGPPPRCPWDHGAVCYGRLAREGEPVVRPRHDTHDTRSVPMLKSTISILPMAALLNLLCVAIVSMSLATRAGGAAAPGGDAKESRANLAV